MQNVLSVHFAYCLQMADFMVGEVVKGVGGSGGSGVRCGIIGEIGCSWPLGDTERRSLQAAALAQKETGEMWEVRNQTLIKWGDWAEGERIGR